jgi:predicted ATPase
MEGLAHGGGIIVSEHTYKLTEGYFEFKPLGKTRIKGVSEPLDVYEVLGVGPLRTRLQVGARRGLVRFVGRQHELEQLRRALQSARAGRGQVVAVMGEPGVGKSRLFHEFVGAHGQRQNQTEAVPLHPDGCLVLEAFSVSHGKAYPCLPLIDLLKNYFQITLHDDERRQREKVMGKVLALDRSLEDTLPYLLFLLGIAESASSLAQMDLQIRRRRTFEAIKRLLVRESLNQSLILIFEDLHWLDTETQAFLTLLNESLATARMLLLVNYRPEYRHDWGNKTYYTQLRLDPLGPADAQELLTALLGDEVPLQPLKRVILEKTEGNPYFIEEIVQDLFEQKVLVRDPVVGAKLRPGLATGHLPSSLGRVSLALTDLHLPTTVQGVLAARIDRLPPEEKELLQTLAVIGKEFPLSLLARVVDKAGEGLSELLSHLRETEFIYEQPAFPEVEYTFKHALTQEVAYGSVLHERRKALHERTAAAMEGLYRATLEDHYGELAHHYSLSGNTQKAVEYLQLAGQQAMQRSANAEALSHLTRALELLKTLPDTPERTQQELALQIALGVALSVTKGFAAPEVGRAYTRARHLCGQVGDTPQLLSVLFGLWVFYLTRGEYRKGRELAEQLLHAAQRVQDPIPLVAAHYMLGATQHLLGELTPARAYLEQGITLYNPSQHRSHTSLYGFDTGMTCLIWLALALWHLGYPDQALQRMREALTLAQGQAHPFGLAIVLAFAAWLHQYRREGQESRERAEAMIALAHEQGLLLYSAWGTILRGWALAAQSQEKEGIAQMREGLAAYRTTGAEENGQTWFLAWLAEAYGRAGQVEEGLNVLAEALAGAHRTGECVDEAELHRLKGELTLKSQVQGPKPVLSLVEGPQVEKGAEECFLKAIEITRRQQAKSLELRAVMSLSRLWQQQGKKEEARQLLAEIYGWFIEGFETADLQEARALLETLST